MGLQNGTSKLGVKSSVNWQETRSSLFHSDMPMRSCLLRYCILNVFYGEWVAVDHQHFSAPSGRSFYPGAPFRYANSQHMAGTYICMYVCRYILSRRALAHKDTLSARLRAPDS